MSDDEASDPTWTPFLAAERRFARARAGEARYPLEETARGWTGETHRIATAAGPFTFHRGRGAQPYVRTRLDDFEGAAVRDDYDSIVRVLSDPNPRVEARRADAILRMARGERVKLTRETPAVRRAMTYLLGLTQVAEESSRRSPGSAAAARASLTMIADEESTFDAQFNRTDGQFVAARRGGTAAMRDVAAGKHQLDEDLAANFSDDDDDDDVAQLAEIGTTIGPAMQGDSAPSDLRNDTGLPHSLKSGVEALSGLSLDTVRVHYNSSRPEALNALAYTQGTDIHVAPGQERHLPHEAWHVVQQAQGRVAPTMQLKQGLPINDDRTLEREADVMGARAAGYSRVDVDTTTAASPSADVDRDVIQACTNPAYEHFMAYVPKLLEQDDPFFDEQSSASYAERSIERGGGAAFIVNAMLPFTEVARIPAVIGMMIAGLVADDAARIAVVLGINAPENEVFALNAALERARGLIQGFSFPVALVRATFRGDFPYGTIRNVVLHSRETRDLTTYFRLSGYHPYISFQDFDTGSRRVGSDEGIHVFHAVDRVLAGVSDDPDMGDFAAPVRPLMIAGGYRPGSLQTLIEDTNRRLRRSPVSGVTEGQIPDLAAGFAHRIAEDMRVRDQYARLDPLLPYAPEPNLFVDATAAAFPSPLTGTPLAFGPHGAEYDALAGTLARYAAEELEWHHAQPRPGVDAQTALARLLVDAHNNRNERRGQTFHTDFGQLTVATDLSRLLHEGLSLGRLPQTHAGLTTVVDRLFASAPAKRGTKLSKIRDEFLRLPNRRAYLDALFIRDRGRSTDEQRRFYQDPRLGTLKRNEFSRALSVPFRPEGPFAGHHFGVPPHLKPYFTHQVALQLPLADVMHESVLTEARRIGADRRFRIGYADGTDHNCTIISIFRAAGVRLTEERANQQRQALAATRVVPPQGDIDLTIPVAVRILELVTAETGERYQLHAVQEVGAAGGPGFTVAPVATNGGATPLFIFFAGNHFSPAWPLAAGGAAAAARADDPRGRGDESAAKRQRGGGSDDE